MDLVARKPYFVPCEQQRRWPACTSAQSDQHLCYSLIGKYNILTCVMQIFNNLVSLCNCADWLRPTQLEIPDRFSHDEANIKTDG